MLVCHSAGVIEGAESTGGRGTRVQWPEGRDAWPCLRCQHATPSHGTSGQQCSSLWKMAGSRAPLQPLLRRAMLLTLFSALCLRFLVRYTLYFFKKFSDQVGERMVGQKEEGEWSWFRQPAAVQWFKHPPGSVHCHWSHTDKHRHHCSREESC